MASRETIRTLVLEADAVVARKLDLESLRKYVDKLALRFRSTPDAQIVAAFDSWLEAQGDRAPVAFPTPGMIEAHRAKAAGIGPAAEALPAMIRDYRRPDPDFVPAHVAGRDAIRNLARRADEKHRHEQPTFDRETTRPLTTGRENCPTCKASKRRQDQIAKILARLPDPTQEERPKVCPCDGTGWYEPEATRSERFTTLAPVDVFLEPCPRGEACVTRRPTKKETKDDVDDK